MPCVRSNDPGPYTHREVRNFGGATRFTPIRVYSPTISPTTIDQLVSIVRQAEADRVPVRAVGSHWSFDRTSETPGYLVDMTHLSGIMGMTAPGFGGAGGVVPAACRPEAARRHLVHVLAGTTVHDLYGKLSQYDLALATQGGSGGQTIVGAVSTGTHGGDVLMPPLADMVRAIYLVGTGGAEHWLERASDPVTADAPLVAAIPCLEGRVHRDDDLFDAALVSLGRMGLIHSVVIEAVPKYTLAERVEGRRWLDAPGRPGVRSQLLDGTEPRGSARYFECLFVAYRQDDGDISCYLTRRVNGPPCGDEDPVTRRCGAGAPGFNLFSELCHQADATWIAVAATAVGAGAAAATAPVLGVALDGLLAPFGVPPGTFSTLGGIFSAAVATGASAAAADAATSGPTTIADLLVAVCNEATRLGKPELVRALVEMLVGGAHRPGDTRIDTSWAIMDGFDYKDQCQRGLSMEAAFDASTRGHVAFLDALFELVDSAFRNEKIAFGGYVSLRFTGATRAHLGMQRTPLTATVEVSTLGGLAGNDLLLQRLQRRAVELGGVLHWGQLNDWAAPEVHAAYPRLSRWRRALAVMSGEGGGLTFDNDYCRQRGLEVAGTAASCRLAGNGFRLFSAAGRVDLAVWRPREGRWYVRAPAGLPPRTQEWGEEGDIPVPGRYFRAQGKSDFAIWRPRDGTWWVLDGETGARHTVQFGLPGDIPVPADYDGDGMTEMAVWRPRNGSWYVMDHTGAQRPPLQWGLMGDVPVPADYDGDGKAEFAVWRPREQKWYLASGSAPVAHGDPDDIPVPASYQGGRRALVATWRPRDGSWHLLPGVGQPETITQWGLPGDVPVPGDYNGQGAAQLAVWRPATGNWYVFGNPQPVQWGLPGDIPV